MNTIEILVEDCKSNTLFWCTHLTVRFYGVMVSTLDFESSDPSSNLGRTLFIYLFMYFFVLGQSKRLRGATVARLTPDQKAACSNHVGVIIILFI